MTWRDVVLRARSLFRRRHAERELAEELDFHLEMQARKHRLAGSSPADAMRRARAEFGNMELVKEDARDVRGVRRVEEIAQDVRYALRSFRRAPTFALAVVLTIGVGIGLSASVFTIFDAYVLRPFDVRDPYSLYSVAWMDRSGRGHDFSRADYDALRRGDRSFSDLAAFRTFGTRLAGVAATGDAVSDNFFRTLGVRPALGALVLPGSDGGAAASPVVVLSHATWRNRFGGDSSIIGRRILLHGIPYQVAGVAQEGFEGLFKKPRDFWIPLGMAGDFDATASRPQPAEDLSLLGRLASGVGDKMAAASVAASMRAITAERPDSDRASRALLVSRASAIPRSTKSFLAFAPLAIAFSLVLLLACANVANMMLARGIARQRELGIRLALGGTRARLIQQLVTESVLLALPAVAVGFATSWLTVDGGVRALFATLPPDLAGFVRLVPLQPDGRVLAFTFAAALASALLFGLVPSLQTTKLSVVQATRGNFDTDASPTRLRNALVVAQVTVSALLLISAAVLLREAARLGQTDTGLRTRDVLSIEISEPSQADVLSRLRANALVDRVAAAATLPLDARFPLMTVRATSDSALVSVGYNRVSASYFAVLQIDLAGGRNFTPQEERGGVPSVIVSQATALRLWPGGNPLGQTIELRRSAANQLVDSLVPFPRVQVVGIARDVVTQSLEYGKEQPIMYFPASLDAAACCLLATVHGDPIGVKRALDAELERTLPGAVNRMDRLETFVAGAVYPYRVAYWVSLALGSIALGLTLMGVYGVVAYVVGQRTREIGIRIALGATTRDVLELVLAQSVRHALIGIGIGGVLALGGARILASNVQSMPAFDLVAFAGTAVCVFATCVGAALVPSRRATAIDPTTTLRQD